MKVAFAGTPEFARTALAALLDAGCDVILVLTQPDRRSGRGMQVHASAVKDLAHARGIPISQPRSLRLDGKYPADAEAARQALALASPDVLVVAAYGLILPPWVLALPRCGCLNIHASLLPRWRGAAPIQRAIEAGDAQTGISIMQMDAGLDTGDLLLVRRIPIGARANAASLHDRLAALGSELIVEALGQLALGSLPRTPQPGIGATYASKISKKEALVDWALTADALERRIRAFDPFPGCNTVLGDAAIKIWRAEATNSPPGVAVCGEILAVTEAGIRVQCGQGMLLLTELQRAGGKRLAAREFLAGFPVHAGERFGASESL